MVCLTISLFAADMLPCCKISTSVFDDSKYVCSLMVRLNKYTQNEDFDPDAAKCYLHPCFSYSDISKKSSVKEVHWLIFSCTVPSPHGFIRFYLQGFIRARTSMNLCSFLLLQRKPPCSPSARYFRSQPKISASTAK